MRELYIYQFGAYLGQVNFSKRFITTLGNGMPFFDSTIYPPQIKLIVLIIELRVCFFLQVLNSVQYSIYMHRILYLWSTFSNRNTCISTAEAP